MKLALSGSRGVYWRANVRGSQRHDQRRKERGDWWIRWACPYGHLHRNFAGPKALAQKEAERRRIERPCPQRQTKAKTWLLADVIDDYVEAAKASKRTWKDDRRYGAVWKARFPGRTLDDITAGDIDKSRSERLQGDAAVTAATVNREVGFLRHVYNVAIRDSKTERNPVARLRFFKERGRVRYLTDDEEPKLMKALPDDESRQRVSVLLQTGLRKSELLGLTWRHVDFKAGVLTIPRSKNGEARHVPMTSTVRDLLSRRPRPLKGDTLVFSNSEGNRDLRWAEKTFPEAVSTATIEDFRLHDLRHTFASRLVMAGVDLLTVMQLGGWKSLTMVQRYGHLSPGHRQAAIERLATRDMSAVTAAAHG